LAVEAVEIVELAMMAAVELVLYLEALLKGWDVGHSVLRPTVSGLD